MNPVSAPDVEVCSQAVPAGEPIGPEQSLPDASNRSTRLLVVEAAAVLILAVATRLFNLDHTPHVDELNHVLAARALLENGTLEIVAGADPYTRAWGFTYLVAAMFLAFGESLVAARIPALIGGALLVLLLFMWVRKEAGRAGAWTAALLFNIAPISIELSQWSRFYTLHALALFVACLLTYRMLTPPYPRKRVGAIMLLTAIACLGVAFHFQITTIVGITGLLSWAVLVGLPTLLRALPRRAQRIKFLSVVTGLALAGMSFLILSGAVEWAVGRALRVDPWAAQDAGSIRFYHWLFLDLYSPLWALFPVAVLIAAGTRFRATLLCLFIFSVGFAAHSVAAWKTERYIFYLLPFFFALWGIAIGGALPWVRSRVDLVLKNVGAGRLSPTTRSIVGAGLVGLALLFAAFSSPSTSYGIKMLTVSDEEWEWRWGGWYRGHADWVRTAEALEPVAEEAEVLLGSMDVAAIHAFGRLDYLLRAVPTGARAGSLLPVRQKTRVPIVSTAETLGLVMSCYATGIVLIDRSQYDRDHAVSAELVSILAERADPVTTPEPRLVAYRWEGRTAAESVACEALTTWQP